MWKRICRPRSWEWKVEKNDMGLLVFPLKKEKGHKSLGPTQAKKVYQYQWLNGAPSFRVWGSEPTMYRGFSRRLLEIRRQLHTLSGDGPSESLRRKIAELERTRKARKRPEKDQLFVEVPESKAYLDTASMPMILTVVGVALFAKLLFMVLFFFISHKKPTPHFSFRFALIEKNWYLFSRGLLVKHNSYLIMYQTRCCSYLLL